MKELTGFLFMLACALTASGQYYYKDVIVTRQTNEKWTLYKSGKVRSVKLVSLDPTGQPAAGFDCKQSVSNNFTEIRTTTVSNMTTASSLTAFYDNKGLLKKTIDTSDTYQSSTTARWKPTTRSRIWKTISGPTISREFPPAC